MNISRYQLPVPVVHPKSSIFFAGRPRLKRTFWIYLAAIYLLSCSNAPAKKGITNAEQTSDGINKTEVTLDPDATGEVSENDIEFESRSVKLTGTIFKPEEQTEKTVGVLILHDWGPWDRYGTAKESFGLRLPVEFQIYRTLAELLAENGVTVMTYDKRSCVAGVAPWCTYDRSYVETQKRDLPGAFLDDAKAALDALAKLPNVAPNQIVVVSHGHGAEVASELALDERVAAVALLTPASDAPDRIAQFQTEQSIAWLDRELAKGEDDRMKDLLRKRKKKLKADQKAQKTTFTALRNGNKVEMAFGLSGKSWQEFIAMHDAFRKFLNNTNTPTMVITGGRVSNEKTDVTLFEKAAESNPKVEHLHIENLSQLMVALDTEPRIPDEIIEAILSVATSRRIAALNQINE